MVSNSPGVEGKIFILTAGFMSAQMTPVRILSTARGTTKARTCRSLRCDLGAWHSAYDSTRWDKAAVGKNPPTLYSLRGEFRDVRGNSVASHNVLHPKTPHNVHVDIAKSTWEYRVIAVLHTVAFLDQRTPFLRRPRHGIRPHSIPKGVGLEKMAEFEPGLRGSLSPSLESILLPSHILIFVGLSP